MKYVLLWIGEYLLFVIFVVLLYAILPEAQMYKMLTSITGMFPDYTWDKYYFLALTIASVLLVALIIYIAHRFKKIN